MKGPRGRLMSFFFKTRLSPPRQILLPLINEAANSWTNCPEREKSLLGRPHSMLPSLRKQELAEARAEGGEQCIVGERWGQVCLRFRAKLFPAEGFPNIAISGALHKGVLLCQTFKGGRMLQVSGYDFPLLPEMSLTSYGVLNDY